jgi:lipopolysaccharide export LptBFGC system permease protein LptF
VLSPDFDIYALTWRKITEKEFTDLRTLESMTPDEQLNELVNRRPELRSAVEASRRFWPRVFTRLAAIASVVVLVILASALGFITVRFAVLFCIVVFAALLGFAIKILVFGNVTFYSAKSTRN